MTRSIGHFINGAHVEGGSGRFGDVFNPTTGEVQARAALASRKEVEAAVSAAERTFAGWREINPQRRARLLFRFKELVEKDMDNLARLISLEHGKILPDARGDVQRGLEVIEFACGIPHLQKGDYTEGAGPGIDVYSMRQPLGVCAGITPFNFPAMIPMWMFGVAIACGNAFVLKPSEKDPSAPLRLAELMLEAGAPEGLLNVVNGDKEAVDALIEDPRVKAISFVGSSDIAHYIYANGARHGKRVQAFGGAKNHMVILPDADMENAVNQLVGSAYGSAGERCMATPVAVPVGEKTAETLVEMLKPKVESLRIGPSLSEDSDLGPLVTAAHRERVRKYIDLAIEEGQSLVVDGRNFALQGYENGFFMGGTLLDHAKPGHKSYNDEIFGPVLQVVRAKNFEEALALPSDHQYGNGVAIFTRNGDAAREFAWRVNVGMVGVNVPIPVPVAYHTFGGWKRSAFGDTNQHGPEGVRFWTKIKTVTQRWPEDIQGSEFVIPTMG
ncbi:CoA-acylating methylmalonate-semialdehyde dehydrogenase [Amphiplicatus metriothermophilus]|uniref:methylmalonate-semialdehyde dehydrogenase (CoA acylating) n=1 Tax=Amphiplicatus metriothermophilus TaxID=1519374 RepID=A0A239PQ58_9PROT|nr:CoA-acylating methylmalonate-semialdehyde dehydrogenase [Amphiplicatus metriothermophilus]MBB5518433.1 malonate-semialdehyde dehydrogenase (acetylating)/methylmalonate-semialdehyde dehydrogenase [Amphiplicatus metriothermophilus]SNT72405.1 methylmalonate-semialdehyde dehydrogenase [acylating] [Amphiplicatus metriothermophilus]